MCWDWLCVVAEIGVLLQGYFAYKETIGWGPRFVKSAAPAWTRKPPIRLPPEVAAAMECKPPVQDVPPEICYAIKWATDLAFNIGIYNLVLAIGLIWVAVAGASVAGSLGTFLGIWLLVAAVAALWTRVYPAFIAQGLLGLAVLVLSILAV